MFFLSQPCEENEKTIATLLLFKKCNTDKIEARKQLIKKIVDNKKINNIIREQQAAQHTQEQIKLEPIQKLLL